jgi:hypothetical protein
MPAGRGKPLQRRVAGGEHRREQQHRHDHQAVAERGGLLQADVRRPAARDDVQQARPLDAPRDLGELLERLRSFDKGDVGTGP